MMLVNASPNDEEINIANEGPDISAKYPINISPKGCIPIANPNIPIVLPLILGEDETKMIRLCIVPNPARPIPININKPNERTKLADNEKIKRKASPIIVPNIKIFP